MMIKKLKSISGILHYNTCEIIMSLYFQVLLHHSDYCPIYLQIENLLQNIESLFLLYRYSNLTPSQPHLSLSGFNDEKCLCFCLAVPKPSSLCFVKVSFGLFQLFFRKLWICQVESEMLRDISVSHCLHHRKIST